MTTDAQQDGEQDGPLRQRKKDRTHAALVREAMRLFSTYGYEETSVDEIAEAAQISRRTLFRYFPGKADIILAWTHGVTTILTDAIRAVPLDVPLQDAVLAGLVPVVACYSSDRMDAYGVVRLVEQTPALRDMALRRYSEWEETLASALIARLPATEMPSLVARLLARTAIATFRTALDEWVKTEGRSDLETILRRTFTLQPLLWQNDFPMSSG
ncbi:MULTISPECIES: TetR family transcriptional regulator [Gluconobacter]|uniref:Transcriptional regulator n=1 Tax=Gluconobacter albidus TaxID=318683 RepID=A0A149T3F2_9PROT|nr:MULTISPECIES: TetR family transcriptional regulator [Gluconobacter]AQS90346.1 transcriptional regulator [Gluconobacter albidus]KXV40732.1 transcriptional regulator [Gluconobacter albidus]KXV45656.1 transcriptional regulator [Gluconobacter albidus]MBS1027604.1 TetR family transcriptional regulator [Gluconobacter albidus]MCP1272876.1 TetR family transcriptional regulator [Gluconobacter albidus]